MQTNLMEMAPTLGLVFIAALAIVRSIVYHRLYNPVVEPRQCPHSLVDGNLSVFSGLPSKDEIVSMLVHHPEKFPSECFFADDYFEARRLFLAQAKKVTGAELQSFAIQDVDHYMDRPKQALKTRKRKGITQLTLLSCVAIRRSKCGICPALMVRKGMRDLPLRCESLDVIDALC
jgi:hypothetical protein